MMRLRHILAALAAFALTLPALATWTVSTDGSTPEITDGHWTIKLNNKYKAAFVSTDETTTILDMTTLNDDLETAGKSYRCTELDANGFRGSSYAVLKTKLTEIHFPDEVTAIGEQCFQNCNALRTVELGSSFAKFNNKHGFSQCNALYTVYVRGETPVEGTIHLPDAVPSLPNYTFENCNQFLHLIARGVKSVGQASVYQCKLCESVELSPELSSVTSGSTAGTFYQDWALSSFSPANMALTVAVGQSCFRELPLDHDLDFSASTFTEVQGTSFYGIQLKDGCRITLPATLKTVGYQAFQQQQNGRSNIVRLRFLGEAPTSLGNYAFEPKNSGYHNVLYVDAKKCPSWTASGFTSVEDDPTLKDQASYPGEKTLGKSTLGVTNSGWWNWLVQENLPKGDVYWTETGTDAQGVVTLESKDGYWTLELVPNGAGGYLARCVSATAPETMALDLGQIEDDTDLPLAGLADDAFAGVTALSEIVLPTGANALGARAFQNCTALATVTLPSTFVWNAAGASAFDGCSALTTLGLASQDIAAGALVLPADATTLADGLFAGTAFTSFTGPGVTSVGARVFDGCSALATVTVPGGIGGLAAIGTAAFRGTALTATMDFTASPLTAIPASLFENCTGLTLVKLPATVTSVGAAAFKNLAAGANISFCGNPPSFGAEALQPPANVSGSRYIIRVESSDSLDAWKAEAFTPTTDAMKEESDYLGNIYHGQSTLGADGASNWLFFLDPSLTWWISGKGTYKRPDNNNTVETFVATDGDCEVHIFTVNNVVYLAPKLIAADGVLDMTTLDADTGLEPTDVFYRSFKNNTAVVKIHFPDSVTTIGQEAFQYASNLAEVELGAGFASFGPRHAFSQCTALATMWKRGDTRVEGQIRIPDNITELPQCTFENVDGIRDVLAPAVVSLGISCFYNCDALTNAVFSPNIHTVANGGSGVFYQCGNLRTISPAAMSLTTLGSDAFRELRLSHGLDFSKSTFTSIGQRAFFGFKAIDPETGKPLPVTFPKTLASVGDRGFYGYNSWNQLYVFLGDRPTFTGTQALDPQGNANRRYYLVVDAKKYPDWTASNFTELAESDKSLADYPTTTMLGVPGYPGGQVLGWSTISSGSYKNWLIQMKSSGFTIIVR